MTQSQGACYQVSLIFGNTNGGGGGKTNSIHNTHNGVCAVCVCRGKDQNK